jgi:hypothetical protein
MDHASSAPAGIPGLGTSSRDLEQETTMQIECAELDNGTLFQWQENVYRKVKDVTDKEDRILHCDVILMAYLSNGKWILKADWESSKFSHACKVQPVKLTFEPI